MNNSSHLKWIRNFLCFLLAIVLLLSGVAYIVDPFMQFRPRDNAYLLEEWYVGSGLIKTYDYDTLILGSSMIQNFDMDVFRQELGVKPLHVGIGAMSPEEMAEFLNLAYDTGKADTYYLCVDLPVPVPARRCGICDSGQAGRGASHQIYLQKEHRQAGGLAAGFPRYWR